MDFFERQDKARKNTKLLVFYFIIAVICIVASVYLASLLIFTGVSAKVNRGAQVALWNPSVFGFAAVGTLVVIVCGSLFKISQLSGGGGKVAVSLGGRPVEPDTSDPDERKLLNVVEEMALASGVPVPEVYVLDDEHGINAFAAGHSTSDAAVAVTRGCMKSLKRDELQGVIGHEFSHILNGDMRLNLRLMGIIFGIVCLTVIGRILLRSGSRSRYHLGARNKGSNPLPLLGLALIIIGGVGVLFGRLIQAAVSRQREFLADASAVQFTRNPDGLSGALQKIGSAVHGSKLETEHAVEACHMFFGNALRQSMFSLMATHPPLEQRIRAIDPGWDGTFQAADDSGDDEDVALELLQKPRVSKPRAADSAFPPIIPFPGAPVGGLGQVVIAAEAVLPNLGKPTPLHLRYAEELRNSFSEKVTMATREPLSAVALVYALLLSNNEGTRQKQLQELAKQSDSTIHQRTVALLPEIAPIAMRARLPLAELAIPALRRLQPDEFQRFSRTLKWLIESDEEIDLFEFTLQKIVRRHLESQFGEVRKPVVQYYSITPLVSDVSVVLSALAEVGHAEASEVRSAFQRGAPYSRSADIQLLADADCDLDKFDAALNRLALAVPQIKKNLLEACVHTVGADGLIQEHEAEMLRAIADTLDCPIPPFVEMEKEE